MMDPSGVDCSLANHGHAMMDPFGVDCSVANHGHALMDPSGVDCGLANHPLSTDLQTFSLDSAKN